MSISTWHNTVNGLYAATHDLKIVHDWSGYYYDGTVYTDAEEEVLIRQQYNL